jgi:Kdo2-lipid IVA lauroyltransferase/acyltransferase
MQTLLYWFAKAIVAGIQTLPLELVARAGRMGGAIAHALDARHRNVAYNNLKRCFPEKTEAEIQAIVRENFRRLGENYACGVKTAGMKFEEVMKRAEVIGLEKLATPARGAFIGPHEEFTAQGTAGAAPWNRIVAIGHFGNFELYAILARCLPGYKHATTFRGLNQPGLNRLMEELRNRSGCLFFERRTGLRDLMRLLSQKGVLLGLLSDQHAGRKGVWAPFFGVECSTNPAPAVFALRYDSPLNTAICYRIGLARWRVEIGDEIPITENGAARSVEAITRDVNAALEAAIRRDPANWFWVHRRWKPRGGPKTPK